MPRRGAGQPAVRRQRDEARYHRDELQPRLDHHPGREQLGDDLARHARGRGDGPTAPGSRCCCRSAAGRAMAGRPTSTTAPSRPTPGPRRSPPVTDHSCIFSTSHVPLVHPVAAAKQCATIDHISGGRFALNIVCGWFRNEFEMFAPNGASTTRATNTPPNGSNSPGVSGPRRRSRLQRRWFTARNVWSQPKPVQKTMPIMNAGGSPAGRAFAATQADMNFVILSEHDIEGGRAQIQSLKAMARETDARSRAGSTSTSSAATPRRRRAIISTTTFAGRATTRRWTTS